MNVTTSYYTTLQVEPGASQEEIEQAYRQLVEQYDPAKLEGLAAELQALTRERRRAIEEAYAVLGDPAARAAYDATAATGGAEDDPEETIDYRPLPPQRSAAGQPRPIAVKPERRLPGPRWLYPTLIVSVLIAAVSIATVLLTEAGRSAPTLTAADMKAMAAQSRVPAAVSAELDDPELIDLLAQQEEVIASLEEQARDSSNPNDWISLGNAIFDYLELIREQSQTGQAYAAVAPRWIKAVDAYRQALQLNPDDGQTRADYALSLLRLSNAIDDATLREEAAAEAEKALRDDPDGLRTMLNAGTVFAALPQRAEEGEQLLQEILSRAPDSREAAAANRILRKEAP